MNEPHYNVSHEWLEKLIEWNSKSNFYLYRSRCHIFLICSIAVAIQMTSGVLILNIPKEVFPICVGYSVSAVLFAAWIISTKVKPYSKFYKDEVDYINQEIFEDRVRQEVDDITSG